MKSHLKRLAMPKTWDIKRKTTTFIIRPHPGSHNLDQSMPLQIMLREVLKVAKTAKEVRYILNNKEISVNGKRRKETKYPVGLMDVIDIADLDKTYRVLLNQKGNIISIEIPKSEASLKPYKISGKSLIKKGRVQLNFSDGCNLIVDKDTYNTDDVIIYDFKKRKILEHLKFDKNMAAFLTGGNYVGHIGTIQDIKGKDIILKSSSGEIFETLKDYAFVIGKEKQSITLTG